MSCRLDAFVTKPQSIWKGRHCTEIDILIRQKGHSFSLNLNHPLEEIGDYCTVEETVPGVWRVETKGAVEPRNVAPVNFLDILMEWGCEWMWEGIQVVVGTD